MPGSWNRCAPSFANCYPPGRRRSTWSPTQFHLHPKTLQRRLADEGTTFAALVDQVRKDTADRYLRTTGISLSHLARELGYAEQSVLTRSCKRWFGTGPAAYRSQTRTPALARA